VQLVGNDMAATPPGHALARAGHVDNVRGFPVMGDGPAAQRLVRAVADGELDAGLAWGPQAAWFAAHANGKLDGAHRAPARRARGPAIRVRHRDGRAPRRSRAARRAGRDPAEAPRRNRCDPRRIPRAALRTRHPERHDDRPLRAGGDGGAIVAGCGREERRFVQPVAAPDPRAQASAEPPLQPGQRGDGLKSTGTAGGFDEDNAYELQQGKRWYRWYNCQGCHSHGGGGMGPR
jgi:hypothetical protein